mmetsp:Transcript_77437/g.199325  ORF Transcript_77437/g.199325 Transcript_77437/m.199325 type:complete len:335 (-) Transcript_77437:1983-2987(-)
MHAHLQRPANDDNNAHIVLTRPPSVQLAARGLRQIRCGAGNGLVIASGLLVDRLQNHLLLLYLPRLVSCLAFCMANGPPEVHQLDDHEHGQQPNSTSNPAHVLLEGINGKRDEALVALQAGCAVVLAALVQAEVRRNLLQELADARGGLELRMHARDRGAEVLVGGVREHKGCVLLGARVRRGALPPAAVGLLEVQQLARLAAELVGVAGEGLHVRIDFLRVLVPVAVPGAATVALADLSQGGAAHVVHIAHKLREEDRGGEEDSEPEDANEEVETHLPPMVIAHGVDAKAGEACSEEPNAGCNEDAVCCRIALQLVAVVHQEDAAECDGQASQ